MCSKFDPLKFGMFEVRFFDVRSTSNLKQRLQSILIGLNHDGVIASHGYASHGGQEEKHFNALHGNDSRDILFKSYKGMVPTAFMS